MLNKLHCTVEVNYILINIPVFPGKMSFSSREIGNENTPGIPNGIREWLNDLFYNEGLMALENG